MGLKGQHRDRLTAETVKCKFELVRKVSPVCLENFSFLFCDPAHHYGLQPASATALLSFPLQRSHST